MRRFLSPHLSDPFWLACLVFFVLAVGVATYQAVTTDQEAVELMRDGD